MPCAAVSQDIPAALQKEYQRVYGAPPQAQADNEQRPNVLLITSDQQHWMAIGYNDPQCKTPNLDRLASMGVVFDRAYTCNPTSTPTRASLITGMYPSQHGAYALGTKLDEQVPTVGQAFAAAGYETALIGKAHFQPLAGSASYPSAEAYPILQDLSFWKEFSGPFYGFEHVELTRNHGDEAHVGQHYLLWLQDRVGDRWKEWYRKPTGIADNQRGSWNMPEAYHMNAWIAERTNALLDSYKESGSHFFIWASFFDPHPPYLVPEPWASMYDPEEMSIPDTFTDDLADMPEHYRLTQESSPDVSKWYSEAEKFWVHGLESHNRPFWRERIKQDIALYYGMISMMDHYIGLILDKLEANGQLDNTIILFTSDHGHLYGHHGLHTKGVFQYEDAIRIPFIVKSPNQTAEGVRKDDLMSVIDIAPSLLAECGIPVPATMTGVDQHEVWTTQQKSARRGLIVENRFQPTLFYVKTYVNERYKITFNRNSTEGELFDLQKDPNELVNLWDSPDYQQIKVSLLLEALQEEMKAEKTLMPRIAIA